MTDKNLLILNALGSEQPNDNGVATGDLCAKLCNELGFGLEYREFGSTAEMLGILANGSTNVDALIVNPDTKSTPSEQDRAAISTAIAELDIPVVEVHQQNIFRDGGAIRPLHVPNGDVGFICGLGATGYLLAIRAVARELSE